MATGAIGGAQLTAQAERSAITNAQLRCSIVPCPECGRRNFTEFKKQWVRNAFGVFVLMGVAVPFGCWLVDHREFEQHIGTHFVLHLAIQMLLQLGIGIGFFYEMREASRVVHFVESHPR